MIKRLFLLVAVAVLFISMFSITDSAEKSKSKRGLTVDDVMKFRNIYGTSISDDGNWVCFYTLPDRGDPEGIVKSSHNDSIEIKVTRGERPQFSHNSHWAVFSVRAKATEIENADKEKPKAGFAIVNLKTKEIQKIDAVKSFKISEDSKWVAYMSAVEPAKNKEGKDSPKNRIVGNDVILRHLETGSELPFQYVTEFEFDSVSGHFTYIVSEPTAKKNGVYSIDLTGSFNPPVKIDGREGYIYSNLKWGNRNSTLAFISAKETKDGDPDSCSLKFWNYQNKEVFSGISPNQYPKDWYLPFKNTLIWTKDGNRLFFGFKPLRDTLLKDDKVTMSDSNYYDLKTIRRKTEFDLWHWNDPRIKTNRKNWWNENKDSTFRSVFNLSTRKFVQLADESMPYVRPADNQYFTVGFDDSKYLKSVTWDNDYNDVYKVDLTTGAKTLIAEKIPEDAYMSPLGKFVVYYKDKDWFIYNLRSGFSNNLTAKVGLPFYDEEWDQPSSPVSHGFAGWVEGEDFVAIYDKYDVWKFSTVDSINYLNQTGAEGRVQNWIFRYYNLDPTKEYLSQKNENLLSCFDDKTKQTNIFSMNFDILGVVSYIGDSTRRTRVVCQSKNARNIIFTKESYNEFPDLWLSEDSTFKKVTKLTDINPILKNIDFGHNELMEWTNYQNDTLQGYVILPDNFDPKVKHPLLVYYYERFSQDLHTFYPPRMNHRPCYPLYSADGYVIFVPDIKYRVGSPGQSALSCVVSGIRKLAQKGYIDTNAIAIQGHSWGGYETAYMITQTPLFAAACAGAPVGNMTSAYSGIRLESGLARQMQYEKQQSRIGGTLWDSLSSFLNNSPIFQAKNTKTPFLIMFGDEDNAVPWQQGIELYLAYRRLNKECYMLEYRNEPHIPRKYQNKLDYAIRMKEFFDHYCLNKPEPDWMLNGIEYRGK